MDSFVLPLDVRRPLVPEEFLLSSVSEISVAAVIVRNSRPIIRYPDGRNSTSRSGCRTEHEKIVDTRIMQFRRRSIALLFSSLMKFLSQNFVFHLFGGVAIRDFPRCRATDCDEQLSLAFPLICHDYRSF